MDLPSRFDAFPCRPRTKRPAALWGREAAGRQRCQETFEGGHFLSAWSAARIARSLRCARGEHESSARSRVRSKRCAVHLMPRRWSQGPFGAAGDDTPSARFFAENEIDQRRRGHGHARQTTVTASMRGAPTMIASKDKEARRRLRRSRRSNDTLAQPRRSMPVCSLVLSRNGVEVGQAPTQMPHDTGLQTPRLRMAASACAASGDQCYAHNTDSPFAAPDALGTAAAKPAICHQPKAGPLATTTPPSVLATIATPILSFGSDTVVSDGNIRRAGSQITASIAQENRLLLSDKRLVCTLISPAYR